MEARFMSMSFNPRRRNKAGLKIIGEAAKHIQAEIKDVATLKFHGASLPV
jgi:uncharacterized protein with HEPN domain